MTEACLNVGEIARRLVQLTEQDQEKSSTMISESIRESNHVEPESPCKDFGF